jgi:tetratricopeptide (TPR) repeat protein
MGRELALGTALSNQGILLEDLGRFSEAVKVLDEAEKLFREQVRADGSPELQARHAQAMRRLAVALDNSARSDMALARGRILIERAVEIFRNLPEIVRKEYRADLASALLDRGLSCFWLGQSERAVSFLDEAAAYYLDLVQTEDLPEWRHGLAKAFLNMAMVLIHNRQHFAGRLRERREGTEQDVSPEKVARDHLEQALLSLERVAQQAPSPECSLDHARALIALAELPERGSDTVQARELYEQAIDLLRSLVKQLPLFDFETALAEYLVGQGKFLSQIERSDDALRCYAEGIERWERLAGERQDWTQRGWIRGRRLRFELLLRLRRWQEAAADMARIAIIPIRMGWIPEVLKQVAAFVNDWIELGATLAHADLHSLMEALAQQPQGDGGSLFARISQGMNCPKCGERMDITPSEPAWICNCQDPPTEIALLD